MHHLVQLFESLDAGVLSSNSLGIVELVCQHLIKHIVHQGRLARPGDSGDGSHNAQWEFNIHIL